jgi:hypothetical protein
MLVETATTAHMFTWMKIEPRLLPIMAIIDHHKENIVTNRTSLGRHATIVVHGWCRFFGSLWYDIPRGKRRTHTFQPSTNKRLFISYHIFIHIFKRNSIIWYVRTYALLLRTWYFNRGNTMIYIRRYFGCRHCMWACATYCSEFLTRSQISVQKAVRVLRTLSANLVTPVNCFSGEASQLTTQKSSNSRPIQFCSWIPMVSGRQDSFSALRDVQHAIHRNKMLYIVIKQHTSRQVRLTMTNSNLTGEE